MIDFQVPADLQAVQRRVAGFVRAEVLPAEEALGDGIESDEALEAIASLRSAARAAGLWNPHLPEEWGGMGLGPLGMALVSQECGASGLASLALNAMAPDEGNMHLLLHAGTPDQRERYLRPLADAEARSCFAMTEKAAGADPAGITTMARRDGSGWVLDGEKWFITGAAGAAFAIVVARTDPDAKPRDAYSLFIVDADLPGWNVLREVPVMGTHLAGGHCEVAIEGCRVEATSMLGGVGDGYKLAQARLGPARLAHCMRWVGVAQRALDMASAYSLRRETFGEPLARRQTIQNWFADSAIELYASRLMVLHAAYLLEKGVEARQEVSMAKVYVSEALGRIVDRAIQVHGALGYSGDLPLERFYRDARAARIYDGPSEVHRMVIARNLLKVAMEGNGYQAGHRRPHVSDVSAPLIEAASLEAYLNEKLGGEKPLSIERHRAGHSNETFFVTRGERELVLRRPPEGAFLPTAHDVGREYTVLSALRATGVRSPATVLMCTDEGIIGAPFYVMERAHGFVVRDELPDAFGPTERPPFGDEVVDALVELHAVDLEACGLGGFGKPSGYLERQLRRWRGQLGLTTPFTRPLPDLELIGDWLQGSMPESPAGTLVHGDFKLDNVMFAPDPPARLVAILDWEMSTLGDPLADLGWLVSFWVDPDERDGVFGELNSATALPGFRTRGELVDRYASASGRQVDALEWYRVLAVWKLAILLEGSYARHLAGATDDPFFAKMERGVPEIAGHARSIARI